MTFKQINPFIAKVRTQMHIRHLSWMKRFDSRVSACITELGQDTPAMLSQAYTALHAAIEHEDQVFLIIQESALTATIEEWDQKRDNTYVGIRTMVEALGRIGTAAQKEASANVLNRMNHYKVDTHERYADESEKISQLIQDLQAQPLSADVETLGLTAQVATLKTENETTEQYLALRQEERAQQDPKAMTKAREATDEQYTLTVQVMNAFAIVEQQQGVSPYDTTIDNINSDQEYYIQHVFTKEKKLKTLKITDEVQFNYVQGETWATAIEEHPQENAGWAVSDDDLNHVLYMDQLLKKGADAVDATSKVASGEYTLETEETQPDDQGGGGEVTPVTPE